MKLVLSDPAISTFLMSTAPIEKEHRDVGPSEFGCRPRISAKRYKQIRNLKAIVNNHLVQRLQGIQQALMAQHSGGIAMPSSSKGSERETFLREFLQEVFPADRRFATGAITDVAGNISGQVDIAVEYGHLPSFPMPATKDRLLLAESVAMAIEVKSNLMDQWDEVQATTKKVKELDRNLQVVLTIGQAPGPKIPCIAVGYTGYKTADGLRQRLESTPENERPDAALVIESGIFSGLGIEASGGAAGLYAMCAAINQELARLALAAPNINAYLESN